jgi:hypothetical protein
MASLNYFNLRIPAPRRLEMMRKDFAEHGAKYPHCPEHAKPHSWRDVRRTTFKGFAGYFGLADQGFNTDSRGKREPIIYAHHPESFAVRRIRDAHEIIDSGHTGWYCDDDCYALCIGIVASLPHGRFLAGYRLSESGEHVLYLADIFDDEDSAARCADSLAEHYAEREREYNEKWREASDLDDTIAEKIEELQHHRATHRACIADRLVSYGSSVPGASLAAERAIIRAARARHDAAEVIAEIRAARESRAAIDIET